jgi:hypothetical protein
MKCQFVNCSKDFTLRNRPAQKYCSSDCQKDAKYLRRYGRCPVPHVPIVPLKEDDLLTKWKDGRWSGTIRGGGASKVVKRYIRQKFNHQCVECQWNKLNTLGRCPVEVHHIDGNRFNNKEDNLTLLCPNCHSLTPTFRFNGRRTQIRTETTHSSSASTL